MSGATPTTTATPASVRLGEHLRGVADDLGGSTSVTDINVHGADRNTYLSVGRGINYEQVYVTWGDAYGVHIK